MLRVMIGKRGGVQAGQTICQVWSGKRLWMSDTRDERSDHWRARLMARSYGGHVLIGGLGLGMFALACALEEKVERVTVIEINPDVIALVLPYLRAALEEKGIDPDKIEVIEADLMEWKPPKGERYDVIWFDIWPDLCLDHLPEYQKLNRRYGRRTKGWRGLWGEDILKRHQREEKKRGRYGYRWF